MLPENQPIDREGDAMADRKQEVKEAFALLYRGFKDAIGYRDLCDRNARFVNGIPRNAQWEVVSAVAEYLNGYGMSRNPSTRMHAEQEALLECIETLLDIE